MNSGKKAKNGSFELIKFVMALSVIIFHGKKLYTGTGFRYFVHGSVACEMFFIISGYFMMVSLNKRKPEPINYMIGRIKTIFPYHTFCFLLSLVAQGYLLGIHKLKFVQALYRTFKMIVLSVPDYFLVSDMAGTGFFCAPIGVEWYLSGMILGLAIIYPIAYKNPNFFGAYIAPLVFLFGTGIIYQQGGSYNVIKNTVGFVKLGLIRAIAMLCLGAFAYWVLQNTKEKLDNIKHNEVVITGCEIVCWVVIMWYMNYAEQVKYEYMVVYFFFAAVYIAGSEKSLLRHLCSNKLVLFLGKLSFPMFLVQGWVRTVLLEINLSKISSNYWAIVGVFIAISMLLGLLCIIVVDSIQKKHANKKALAVKSANAE